MTILNRPLVYALETAAEDVSRKWAETNAEIDTVRTYWLFGLADDLIGGADPAQARAALAIEQGQAPGDLEWQARLSHLIAYADKIAAQGDAS